MKDIKDMRHYAKRYLALVEDAFVQGEFDFSGNASNQGECRAKNRALCPHHGIGSMTPEQKVENNRWLRLNLALRSKKNNELKDLYKSALKTGDTTMASVIKTIFMDRRFSSLTDEGFDNLGEKA